MLDVSKLLTRQGIEMEELIWANRLVPDKIIINIQEASWRTTLDLLMISVKSSHQCLLHKASIMEALSLQLWIVLGPWTELGSNQVQLVKKYEINLWNYQHNKTYCTREPFHQTLSSIVLLLRCQCKELSWAILRDIDTRVTFLSKLSNTLNPNVR